MLLQSFLNKVFSWDNSYFKTLKTFVIEPDVVAGSYINGIRKRYISPIAFLVIGGTITTLVLNAFADKYVDFSSYIPEEVYAADQSENFNPQEITKNDDSEEPKSKLEKAIQRGVQNGASTSREQAILSLKYFNLIVFLTMPFYTFVALIVFGKERFNYAEHLLINAYIQGFSTICIILFFFLALISHSGVYIAGTVLVPTFYYLFTYKKLCKISWKKTIWKFFKFILIVIILVVIFGFFVFLVKFLGKTF